METTKLDALVVAAHPDDAEISLGGTILRLLAAGRRVGILDLTGGELGTRGTSADRARESAAATERLGLHARANLGLPDGRVEASLAAREALARALRAFAPELVFAPHMEDLHPDHACAGRLAREAWFLAGLARLAEQDGGPPAHRPSRLFHYMGHVPFEPSHVVDVTAFWEKKVAVVRCYASQLEPAHGGDRGSHFLFGADIVARAESKARFFGERIGVRFGEPLLHLGPISAHETVVP